MFHVTRCLLCGYFVADPGVQWLDHSFLTHDHIIQQHQSGKEESGDGSAEIVEVVVRLGDVDKIYG